jgi:hypothetical protein
MERELRDAGLLDKNSPEGDVLNCRFARVSAQYIREGFIPYIPYVSFKTTAEVDLNCFVEQSGWRYNCVGEGKWRMQNANSVRASVEIAIDDATQKLIAALAERLRSSSPKEQTTPP